jgi:hypothetical protein
MAKHAPSATERIAAPAAEPKHDIERILALPERPPEMPAEEVARVGAALKARLGIANGLCACRSRFRRQCCSELRPVQVQALHEIETVGGLLGPIGVGHGKTLIDLLAAMVMPGVQQAVLLLPPNLKTQLLEADWHYYGQHWKLPNLAGGRWHHPERPLLHVIAYSELSGSKNSDLLSRLKPDFIILDEAQNLADPSSARTKRYLRYYHANKPKQVAMSGTLVKRALSDYAHLSAASLGDGAPTPHSFPVITEWTKALDPKTFGMQSDIHRLRRPGDDLMTAFRRRLVSTPGVVSSGSLDSCQASLTITERPLTMPPSVLEQYKKLVRADGWQRPDGEELYDALQVATCARQLAAGFYYRWRWPRGEALEVRQKWLDVRKEWHRELREKLKHSKEHMDSPLLLWQACERWFDGYVVIDREEELVDNPHYTPDLPPDHYDYQPARHVVLCEKSRREIPPKTKNGPKPVWAAEWFEEWRRVKDTCQPETEAVWLDDFMLKDAQAWLEAKPGLVWYEFSAFGYELVHRNRGKLTHACPGEEGNLRVLKLTGKEHCVISIRAHGTGKNLQMFHRNLVANPPAGGDAWEQMLGRSHRAGQEADEVTVEVYRHTPEYKEAVQTARDLAGYIQGTFGGTQKLVSSATWGF